MTSISVAAPQRLTLAQARRGVSWTRAIRSEWIKFSTTRSTYLLLGITVLILVGVWTLAATGFVADAAEGGADAAGLILNPYSVGLTIAVGLAQLGVGVLGVMFVTSEYASGMVRATFAAVPARLPVLLAKAGMLILVVLATTTPAIFVAFFLSGLILAPSGLDQSLSDPGMLRALIGGGLYLAGIAVLGASLGWLFRSAAAAIATFVVLVILIPMLLPLIPSEIVHTITDYLPSVVGQEVFRLPGFFDDLTKTGIAPWSGFAIFVGYGLVVLTTAAFAVWRRDA